MHETRRRQDIAKLDRLGNECELNHDVGGNEHLTHLKHLVTELAFKRSFVLMLKLLVSNGQETY